MNRQAKRLAADKKGGIEAEGAQTKAGLSALAYARASAWFIKLSNLCSRMP
jgi:hypothetical protein